MKVFFCPDDTWLFKFLFTRLWNYWKWVRPFQLLMNSLNSWERKPHACWAWGVLAALSTHYVWKRIWGHIEWSRKDILNTYKYSSVYYVPKDWDRISQREYKSVSLPKYTKLNCLSQQTLPGSTAVMNYLSGISSIGCMSLDPYNSPGTSQGDILASVSHLDHHRGSEANLVQVPSANETLKS